MAARSAFAYSRAAAAISPAGTPVIASAASGVYFSTWRAISSSPSPRPQTRQLDVARVGDDEARAVSHRLLDAQRDDGMGLRHVGADDHDQRRPLQLRDRVAHRSPSHHDRQTGDRWGGAGTGRL